MRVMHLVHTPRYSGAETLVLALARLHAQQGHQCAVSAMAPAEQDFLPMLAEQESQGIQWFCPENALRKFDRLAYFRKTAKAFKPDVIFAHSVLPAAYGRLAGLSPVVSVLHDASEHDYKSTILGLSERLLQYRSAGVIAVSPRAAKRYQETYGSPQVRCIPNGIDLDAYRSFDDSARARVIQELGLPEDARIVLQVGRVTAIKQQHLSIRALGALVRDDKKIHFLIAGILESDESMRRITEAIEAAGCAENIHLLGPRKDVSSLLSAADLYLMPSLQEAHSVAMIEALASGVQVVASRIPPFEYAASHPGVELITPENSEEYAAAISRALELQSRFKRDLAELDIRTTAARYIDFSNDLIS